MANESCGYAAALFPVNDSKNFNADAKAKACSAAFGCTVNIKDAQKQFRIAFGNTSYSEEELEAVKALSWTNKTQRSDNFKLTFSNITSLSDKVGAVIENAQEGIHVVVETKADEATIYRAEMEAAVARRSGKNSKFLWGEPRAKENEAQGSTASAGIALIEGPEAIGTTIRIEPRGEQQTWLRKEGRLEGFKTTMRIPPRRESDKGWTWMYTIAVYGTQGKPKEAEEIVKEAWKWAEEFPQDCAVFIVGDFNLEPHESETMWNCKTEDRWIDLHEYYQLMKGRLPANTTERRIDFACGIRKRKLLRSTAPLLRCTPRTNRL